MNQQGNEWNLLSRKNHEDHIASKGFTSMTHYNLVHKFIRMPQVMKIPDAKAAVDKEWKKLVEIRAWSLEKVKSKKEVLLEAQKEKNKVHFATLMDIRVTSRMRSWNPITEVLRQSCALGRHCKSRLWSPCSFFFLLNRARLRPR